MVDSNASPARPMFTGPDGQEYVYADPADSPDMDDVDSTSIPAVQGAPTEDHQVGTGESTPADGRP